MPETSITSFLGSTLPDIDNPEADVMIDVDNVTMSFNIANEQLNSLKEYAIALARHELRFKEFRALDGISLRVRRGDVFGILGTNGSGKSTLMKIIAGVLEPSQGKCTVNGSIAPLIELGAGFDLELTARENIYLNGALLGYSKRFIDQHFDEIVEFAEIRQFLDMPLKNYSSGMVARIAFAIATVIVPDILIVDEVLSVGDFMFQQKCEQRIQALIKEHGVTVLIVSHNNSQIRRLCNKVAWIEKGHLRALGETNQVCELYQAIGGRVGSPESERIILETLRTSSSKPLPEERLLFGETRFGTAIQLNTAAKAPEKTILLTNSDSESSNYIAGSLAGALNASILTTQEDRLPNATKQRIIDSQPETIIVIGDDTLISPNIIEELPTNIQVARIETGAFPTGIEAFAYGNARGAWGNQIALTTKESTSYLAVLSPYFFSARIPLFFIEEFSENDWEAISAVEKAITVNVEADTLPASFRADVDVEAIKSSDPSCITQTCNAWIERQADYRASDSILVACLSSTIDNCLIGPFAGRVNAQVVLEDPRSLDSIAATIQLLAARSGVVRSLFYLGSDLHFSQTNRKILGIAASSTLDDC